ncbi:MAG: disulfide bond formation protein B [Gammaproteobacteria bacterium]|nr:disulfide bond formation protein B [Gammaproteobacteria bacterium]MCW8910584.1 disulfide bond formation protein B [Gammaproteobacteria bacterium]MCW9006106.1 disulfide bond formation protein B [Gammaproteobacteria bacterium]MCW9056484.1 disulfide bond formation protein B [Gammaproteobacteria bacterium]
MLVVINRFERSRLLNLAGFIICVAAMLFAIFYLQGVLYLTPCPLCIIDRVLISAMAVIFLVAAIHNPQVKGRLIYAAINLLLVISALLVALRHVWLQHLPADQVPECGAGLSFMLDVLPLWEVIEKVFTGSGECAEVQWRFLGMSIPEQTLLLFTGLLVLIVFQFISKAEK